MTEKELEKLFQDKLKNREVAFNPASWEKMKPMLADLQPAPAWWQTRRAAALVGAAGLSAVAYFWTTSEEVPAVKEMPSITVVPSGSSDRASPSNESTSSIADAPSGNDQATVPSTANSNTQSLSSTSSETIGYEEALAAQNTENSLVDAETEAVASTTESAVVTACFGTTTTSTQVAATSTTTSVANDQTFETNSNTSPSEIPSENSTTISESNTQFAENLNSPSQNTIAYEEVENTPGNSVELTEVTTVEKEEVTSTEVRSASAIAATTTKNKEAIVESPADEDVIINRSNSQKSRTDLHEFILLAGTNASFPYASSVSESNAPSFSYYAGLEYRYYFSPTYSIRSGLSFAEHSDVNCLRIASEKVYDFGSTIVTEHVKTKNFQFLEIPLTLGINLAPNFSVNAGGYAAFMVNMENEITTVTETALDVSHSVTNQSGYTNAYSNWDAGFKAGVTYRITNRFLLGAEGTFGLIDQTKNEYFLQDSFDRNIQARFYIGYKLF
jgi:ribosomal protein L21